MKNSEVLLRIQQLNHTIQSTAETMESSLLGQRCSPHPIHSQLQQLREALHSAVEIFLDKIKLKLNAPFRLLVQQLEPLKQELEILKSLYQKEDISQSSEQGESFTKLEQLETRIAELVWQKEHFLSKKTTLQLGRSEVLALIEEAVKVNSHCSPKRKEEMLLCEEGKFSLENGAKRGVDLERDFSLSSTLFQIHQKLYVNCSKRKYQTHEIRNFICCEPNGKCVQLSPLTRQRFRISLTGLPEVLLAIGGVNSFFQSFCEKYMTRSDKWVELPPMNQGRSSPGSCLLSSMKAFCFYGLIANGQVSKSIESLQIDAEDKWRVLEVQLGSRSTSAHLGGVSLEGAIYIFGGTSNTTYLMHKVSEEGELIEDLSSLGLIPGAMRWGSYVARNESLYAIGYRKWSDYKCYSLLCFNGKWWSFK